MANTATTNHYLLSVTAEQAVIHYAVEFQPPIISKGRQRELMERVREQDELGDLLFDGTQAYIPGRGAAPEVRRISIGERGGVVLQPVRVMSPAEKQPALLQAYNVLLADNMRQLGFVRERRGYVRYDNPVRIADAAVVLYQGYEATILGCPDGLHLTADIVQRFVRDETAAEVLRRDRGGEARELLDRQVVTAYNGKTYRVREVLWEQTPTTHFQPGRPKRYPGLPPNPSYADYLWLKHHYRVQDMKQPILLCVDLDNFCQQPGPRQRYYLVPECCRMVGLPEGVIKNRQLMQSLRQYMYPAPAERMRAVGDLVARLAALLAWDRWGLRLTTAPLRQTLAQMPQPRLLDGRGPIRVNRNMWTPGRPFREVPLRRWACVYPRRLYGDAEQLARGLNLPEPSWTELPTETPAEYAAGLRWTLEKHTDLQIVLVLLPDEGEERYAGVTRLAAELGVPSQCVLARTLRRQNVEVILSNLRQQINNKVGGASWRAELPGLSRTMLLGMDVEHALQSRSARGRVHRESTVGFVATLDAAFTKYYSRTTTQAGYGEIVRDLDQLLAGALEAYHAENGTWPEQLLLYRDGVGDSMLAQVQRVETAALRETFQRVTGRAARLLVLVCKKRTGTRLFAGQQNPPSGALAAQFRLLSGIPLENSVSGTSAAVAAASAPDTQERTVVVPLYEFLLVGQAATQGTVAPVHYVALYDDTGLAPELVHRLTYGLCCGYYGWGGPVTVPAPVQFAHKLAYRVGEYTHEPPAVGLATRLHFL